MTQPNAFQQFADPGFNIALDHPEVFQRQGDILPGRFTTEQRGGLKNGTVGAPLATQRLAAEHDRSLR